MNRKYLFLVFLSLALVLSSCREEIKQENLPEVEKEELDLIEDEEFSNQAKVITDKYLDLLDPEDKIELLSVKAYKEKGSESIYKLSLQLYKTMEDKEELKEFTEKHSELIERQLYKNLDYERVAFSWLDSKNEEEFEYIYYK